MTHAPVPVAPPAALDPDRRDELHAAILEHGALLVRGLAVRTPADAAAASRRAIATPMPDREPFAPRVDLGGGVGSSSAWPPDQPMCMHHECSYALDPPRLIVLCCLRAPTRGGATALADAGAVLDALPPALVARFERVGWRLSRCHGDVVGVPWPEAFGTSDRAAVERRCRQEAIDWRWDPARTLRTTRVRAAVVRHPVTGRRLWFNQIAFLSEWTMEPAVREYLVEALGHDALPFNTASGDGRPLDRETVETINAVYEEHAVRVAWRDGDVLIIDNLRMAHSRDPYQGEREVVVALGDPAGLSRS